MCINTCQTDPAFTSCAYFIALFKSLVIMPEASPYSVSFDLFIASSNVLNFNIDWTGPKICKLKQISKTF